MTASNLKSSVERSGAAASRQAGVAGPRNVSLTHAGHIALLGTNVFKKIKLQPKRPPNNLQVAKSLSGKTCPLLSRFA